MLLLLIEVWIAADVQFYSAAVPFLLLANPCRDLEHRPSYCRAVSLSRRLRNFVLDARFTFDQCSCSG